MYTDKFDFDLIIIGGGINGAGIAADAAGRGIKTALFEAGDFACATSSASSKLIHGGLRYLEQYEFKLVSKALAEREVLLNKAPHIIKPMRFRLPHRPFLRPAWMIRIGLFLYDFLATRDRLSGSKSVDLKQTGLFKPEFTTGFEYSDCWVDDARLVLLNIKDAATKGASVANYCQVTEVKAIEGGWQVKIHDKRTGSDFVKTSRALVNATGPWVESFLQKQLGTESPRSVRLVKGSHIVVKRFIDTEEAYILQNQDQRIVFVIPYLDKYSMIGTTDVEYQGDPRNVSISQDETEYLLDVVNQHFVHTLSQNDIVWSFSGVRPLCNDESSSPQAVTRDYTMELEIKDANSPILSVFGGKITTYRKLAEAALEKLGVYFPEMGSAWTKNSLLPGAENFNEAQLYNELTKTYPWLDTFTVSRYIKQFGSDVHKLLSGVVSEQDMGEKLAAGVYSKEIDYLLKEEYAFSVDDIIWRRTKLGLELDKDDIQAIRQYIAR